MSTPPADKPPVCSPEPAVEAPVPADSAVPTAAVPPALPAGLPTTSSVWPPAGYTTPGTLLHWVFLAMSALVIIASFTFRVRDGQEVIVPIVNVALPGTCTFRRLTGVPCPGCGLTRSFISLGHGQLLAAWRYNPAGFVFFTLVAFQIPYRIYQIRRIRSGRDSHRFEYLDNWFLVLLVAALVVQWVCVLAMRMW